jgi:Holliday junction resolvasome RuvABC DNA-binding subunit
MRLHVLGNPVTGPVVVAPDKARATFLFHAPVKLMPQLPCHDEPADDVVVVCEQADQTGVQTWFLFPNETTMLVWYFAKKAQGVGPKTALKLLAQQSLDDLRVAVWHKSADELKGWGGKQGVAAFKSICENTATIGWDQADAAPVKPASAKPAKMCAAGETAVKVLQRMGAKKIEAVATVTSILTDNPDLSNDEDSLSRRALAQHFKG